MQNQKKIRIHVKKSIIELVKDDITHQDTKAIVNAANNSLLGGGGVDGAIHRAAGGGLLEECRKIGGCNTGDAKITGGYDLKAKYVIHTVGPVYKGTDDDARLLRSAYKSSLDTAVDNGINTISFPAISAGAYGYPAGEAAKIAIETVMKFLKENNSIELVRFVLYGDDMLETYEKQLNEQADGKNEC